MRFSGAALTEKITRTDTCTNDGDDPRSGLFLYLVCPEQTCRAFPLEAGLTIGRDHDCTIQVGTAAVSRRHARFENRAGLFYCVDLGSRNGTYVNGRQTMESPVAPGDIVRCGDTVWIVSLHPGVSSPSDFGELAPGLYGGNTMAQALSPLRKFASSTVSVVLEGETGVGKELVARALHGWSGRPGPYVAVNCAALPDSLCEGELFGYRKGSFTGADRSHAGYFRAANHGTLLLDEICELAPRVQAKLLRALEQREVIPLGESRPQGVDVRIVAAAQRSLQDETSAGRFREDLLTRLGVTVRIPPLRERTEDTVALFMLFVEAALGRKPQLHARFVESLLQYDFPKNVRELRRLADWVALMHRDAQTLRRSHLPDWILAPRATQSDGASSQSFLPIAQSHVAELAELPDESETRRTVPQQDLPRLVAALEHHHGNVVRAADEIGLSRHQAYRLLRGCPEISLDDFRRDTAQRASRLERAE